MTSNEIRQKFLDFFESKDHLIEQGHSLIPHNDPTLLWINSGVAALKKYFDGSIKPEKPRIANVQKAIRSNDIENVGKTARHHTFFEMLGNFSIGDYFKKEAIEFAYEFLTSDKWMGIDKDKLYYSVHTDDQEAYDLWVNHIGIDPSRISKQEGNFWQIGEGPSGPNSEIFFDRGPKYDPQNRGIELFYNDEENDRYVEVWNIVFSQYNAVDGVPRHEYKELPQKNIDTGMGFERLVNVIQGGETNFDTDLFLPIIRQTEKYSQIKYNDNKIAYRVIADHIRTVSFALADGALFSNEGRGYVLRRIIRRAIRYSKQLNIKEAFMYKLVDVVAEIMKDFYPSLEEKKDLIKKLVKIEEDRFEQTLHDGEKLLQSLLQSSTDKVLLGADVFKLYDTYGFPYELTLEIALENGFEVDQEGYQKHMLERKQLSRGARESTESFSSQNESLMSFMDKSEFIGYDSLMSQSKVIGLFKDNQQVQSLEGDGFVIFDQTPFYAESGGQVADTGVFNSETSNGLITEVLKAPHKQHLHAVTVDEGELVVGDTVTLSVDRTRRLLIQRNHTSVHLLQAALLEVLGSHIAQAGSYVDADYARFDFTHFEKVTPKQQEEVVRLVNQWIVEANPLTVDHMSLQEAKDQKAIGLFESKYGDLVRVVSVGQFSKELCGGTHVSNTNELGLFVIESEESIGSGIRRITSKTSKGATEYLNMKATMLHDLANHLQVNDINKSIDKIDSLTAEIEEKTKQLNELNNKILVDKANSILQTDDASPLIFKTDLDSKLVKTFMDILKSKASTKFIFGVFESNNKLNLACYVPKELIAKGLKAGDIVKQAAQLADGNGGGKPDFAQAGARNVEKVDEVIEFVTKKVSSIL